MDYLQYFIPKSPNIDLPTSFKPYYKWITFNMINVRWFDTEAELF